jgi:hypothetical protein
LPYAFESDDIKREEVAKKFDHPGALEVAAGYPQVFGGD